MRDIDISVVVPTRLGGSVLEHSLAALADQTLDAKRFEVIVVQYGPDDGTRAVVDSERARTPSISLRYVVVAVSTRAAAKSVGVAASRGDHLAFLHDDDQVSPAYLERLLTAAVEDRVALAPSVPMTTGRPADLSSGAIRRHVSLNGRVLSPGQIANGFGSLAGMLLPRRMVERIGFDDGLVGGEDIVFLARLLLSTTVSCAVVGGESDALHFRMTGRDVRRPREDARRLLDAVHRVLTLPLRTSEHLACRARMVEAETDELNRYLRANPDDHAVIVGERRRRGLLAVDLARLNRGVARDLAVLYTAVPYVDTSANVAARRILATERIVDVISCDMSSHLPTDASSAQIWEEYVDQVVRVDARPAASSWPGVTEFCQKGLERITAHERSKGPYRTVYSRVMHPSSHFLAGWFKIRRPEVVWTAEFSDPVRHGVYGSERASTGQPDPVIMQEFHAALEARGISLPEDDGLFLWLETLAYALADEIVFTNRHQRDYMLERFPDQQLRERARRRSTVRPHPKPPTRLYFVVESTYPMTPDLVNLAYFGVFYPTRGLSEIWRALQQLSPEIDRRLRLHVFTTRPRDLAAQLASDGLDRLVVANPYVSYLEYLNLATRADVLLVNDAHTLDTHDRNPYLPSKWSDYSGSGSAVWGIVERGSILSTCPLDYRSELGDVAGAAKILTKILDDYGDVVEARTRPLVKTEHP